MSDSEMTRREFGAAAGAVALSAAGSAVAQVTERFDFVLRTQIVK